jgi:EAL domain-containing protein (putative c-di-GMP-specific phosphodiesterase class I)
VRRPFEVDGLTLEIGASVGMAAFPANGNDVTTLIQRADIAMYAAKESDLGYAVYDPDHDRHSTRRLALAGELRTAIENGQLTLHFQPKADLRTGDLVGVEALVRWEHPELGLLGPDEFIPIAERTGSITPLTRYVLEAALSQARAWRDAGVPITVAVNLSARSFLDTQLAGEIPKLLESWDVAPSLLELEITESMIMTDPVRAKGIIDRLSSYGVSLAIDDFGTGYSSLAHLQRLPVNEIKIDKSFIVEMQRDKNAAAIVSSTIELAHSLQMRVVAEGVENAETWNELARLGCDIAQGFYISRPVSAELQALLESPAAGGPDGADRDGHAVRRRPRVRTRPGAVQTLEA